MNTRALFKLLTALLLMASAGQLPAEEIRVAVASNFTNAMKELVRRFELNSGHKVKLIFGSTGKHYAMIKNGAPFDAFFAADVKRPKLLEQEKIAQPGSRFTYAVGKIVLWSPKPNYVDAGGRVLEQKQFRYIAAANPKLAPYGKAAKEVLQARGLWQGLRSQMVRGENIGQTYQFVKSGNAELGFVAASQVKRPGYTIKGSMWEVPQSLYTPIEQQAVLLRGSSAAQAFMTYVKSSESRQVISGFGYGR